MPELLESRRMLSVSPITFNASVSQIVINGSSAADQVVVSSPTANTIHVHFTSGTDIFDSDFQKADVTSITFGGGDGNDRFENQTDISSYVLGGAGDDVLIGGSGSDTIYGGDGNDTIYGGDGNDNLYGEGGSDVIYGGAGDDMLLGDVGDDRLYGGDGNDTLYGGDGNDQLYGEGNNDFLNAGSGDDILSGGLGDDTLYGGDGNDTLYGGDGIDQLYGEGNNDLIYAGAGDDKVLGGLGDDRLYGGDGNDTLYGEDGNDQLYGEGNNDYLSAGLGDDILSGGLGDDSLYGSDGNDTLYGGDGNDQLYGEGNNDLIYAGAGDDKALGGLGDDRLYGGDGNDTLYGEDGNDQLYGEGNNDYLSGGLGDDVLSGDLGDDALYGSDGNDALYGGDGNDQLYGEGNSDLIYAGAGDDKALGGLGDDTLYGGDGNDTLYGEDGNDQLYGEGNDDYLSGGDGDDTISGGLGNDTLYGGDGNDTLSGDDGNDQLYGEGNNDFLYGSSGDDRLLGGLGDDVLSGGAGNDTLQGEDGNDVLIGGRGQDSLTGLTGNDLLIGGFTRYDDDPVSLRAIQAEWISNDLYATRIQHLVDESFASRLVSNETVFDDGVADALVGGDGQDWFFETGVVPDYVPPDVTQDQPAGSSDDGDAIIVVRQLPQLEGFAFIDSLDHLTDVQTGEQIASIVPHADTPSLQREHLTLFQLVRYDQVTNYAVRSGAWSDPSIWQGGSVPSDGAHVLIPFGVKVTVDSVLPQRIGTIRVDGTLAFATTANTELKVDTLVESDGGRFEMGTEANPVQAGVTAHLMFTDNGPIDRTWDPFGISRGFISHGSVSMYGAAVTSFVNINASAAAGSNRLLLASSPVGWRVGDEVVLAAPDGGPEQNQVRHIVRIKGSSITLDQPFAFDQMPTSPSLTLQIANLSRNVVIDSEATSSDRNGHVMFMHTRDVSINYAGFYNLGRTDKSQPINDAVVDANWHLVPGTGTNPRGRYAVHFHRNGTVNDGNPSIVHGSVVDGSPGWGFVNHSSYVDMSDNVAFDVTGAGFVTEAGDEIGSFVHNISIGATGSGEDVEARTNVQDFGHEGDGFWFQGTGITVTDNIAAGNAGSGFIYFGRGLIQGGVETQFRSQNLPDPSVANGAATVRVGDVPVLQFARNTAYNSSIGLTVEYHMEDATYAKYGTFSDSTFWNDYEGVALPYSNQVILQNLTVVAPTSSVEPFVGIEVNDTTKNIVFNNLTVTGYHWGIDVPLVGITEINGGYYDNQEDFAIRTARGNRSVLINGPIAFGPRTVYQVQMYPQIGSFNPDYIDYTHVFLPDTVILNYGPFVNQEVYYVQQLANYVPFPVAATGLAPAYVGLTNQQLH
ncbi:MAG TPA: G8 domain-containing protein, partial [Lacipirellulaceae bacterium]